MMAWSGILNKQTQIERFKKAIQQNRLASTYLFVGPPGIGKRLFALRLAQALLCEVQNPDLEACGQCGACLQVLSLNHPDLILISKPIDKAFIPVELFIGDKDHRRQEGLIHDIGLKPYSGGRKIAIIDDADCLNQEGANSLLKTLEEPPPMSVLVLIGTSQQQQLPTILSRSQVIRFDPLTTEQVLHLLQQDTQLETEVPLDQLAAAAEGSMEYAYRLADLESFEFRKRFLAQLANDDPGDHDFAKELISFVEAAGTEGALKRDRLSFVGDLAVTFFRRCYQSLSGIEPSDSIDLTMREIVESRVQRWGARSAVNSKNVCAEAIERTIQLQDQIWMNVSVANIVDAWVIDLGRIYRGRYVP